MAPTGQTKYKPGLLYEWALRTHPERTAAIFGDRRLTFRELDATVNRLANGLGSYGLEHQARVAVLMSNSIEALVVMRAVERAGLVFVRLNPLESNEERRWILDDSGAALLVLDRRFEEDWLAFESSIGRTWTKICVPRTQSGESRSYDELLEQSSAMRPNVLIAPDDMIHIAYTSGTTGRPKGVVMTHSASLNRIRNDFLNLDIPLRPDDVLLTVAPLTHAAGLIAQLYAIRGAANVILERFDVEKVLNTIERDRITAMLAVPTMIVRMLQHPGIDELDLSSLRRIYYGTAPMPVEHLKRAIAVFGPIFRQQYGLTEHPQPVLYLYPEDHVIDGDKAQVQRLASMGRRVVGVEVKIVGGDGEELPPGEPGEIWVRSDAMMAGYWQDPEATAAAITADGWLKTGDIAVEDADGFVTMVDRKKEMIVTGGFNVYPREVELVLETHPEIVEAVVFGVPHEEWGEAVTAAVALAPDSRLDGAAIIEHCRGRLARYKLPKAVELHQALPRNTAGKLLRRLLREPHWTGRDRKI